MVPAYFGVKMRNWLRKMRAGWRVCEHGHRLHLNQIPVTIAAIFIFICIQATYGLPGKTKHSQIRDPMETGKFSQSERHCPTLWIL